LKKKKKIQIKLKADTNSKERPVKSSVFSARTEKKNLLQRKEFILKGTSVN